MSLAAHTAPTGKRVPMRTCVGCRQVMPQAAMLRLAAVPDAPFVVPDARRILGGRGLWVEGRRTCVERAARKGGFRRALRKPVTVDAIKLVETLNWQLEKRLWSLIGGGYRGGKIVFGTDTVRESIQRRRIVTLGVATDAAGRADELSRRSERTVLYGTKDQLGEIFGKQAVGVYAIEDAGLAFEVIQVTTHLKGLREATAVTYETGNAAAIVAGDQENA